MFIMKKVLFSLAILLFSAGYTSAQSFTLKWGDETLGDTATVLPDAVTASEIVFEATLYNNTASGTNVKMVRNEIFLMEGSSNYICIDTVCYSSLTDTSAKSMYIPAGGSVAEGAFSGHYDILGTVGISIIEYTFYNIDNPDENVKIFVKYDTSPTDINENILNNIYLSDIYPNPSTNYVSVNYELPSEVKIARVKIVNLLGEIVMEQQLDTRNSNMRMNISILDGGIYFYLLFINGEIFSTKKLIIK